MVVWEWDTIAIQEESLDNTDEGSVSSSISEAELSKDQEHRLNFKCIGATRDREYQDVLANCKRQMSNGVVVPCRLFIENEEDKKCACGHGVVIELQHASCWNRIGYMWMN